MILGRCGFRKSKSQSASASKCIWRDNTTEKVSLSFEHSSENLRKWKFLLLVILEQTRCWWLTPGLSSSSSSQVLFCIDLVSMFRIKLMSFKFSNMQFLSSLLLILRPCRMSGQTQYARGDKRRPQLRLYVRRQHRRLWRRSEWARCSCKICLKRS